MLRNIGKYEIRRQIGRGAMGVVFEAFDTVIERRVAIKTLRLEIFEESQLADVRTRFKREAQSAGRMSHPHIVTVYDYGEHEGTPYIVMEYMTGSELSKVLERGTRLPLSEVIRLMTQLLGALAYAHEHKVVHRDIKPGNIFVLDDGSLKVVDFGIARVEASNLTDTGALLGTPAYMSPEQFLALPIDERSDIFSAGVILYELLTGDKPFTGSVTTIMQKVLRQEPIEPSVLNPLLSDAWDAAIKRAMAKKPEERFQSARQFAETVKQVFESGAQFVSVEATLLGDKHVVPTAANEVRSNAAAKPDTKVQQPVSILSNMKNAPASMQSRRFFSIAAGLLIVVSIGVFAISSLWRSKFENASQEKAVAEQVAILKRATESAAQERTNKLAAEKATQDRAAAEKVAVEKAVAERLAQIKTAQDKEIAEKAVAQKKKAAQEKAVAEKAAAERTAAANTGSTSLVTSRLLPCKAYETWTNCVGTLSLTYGEKYVGEFEDGERNGRGTEYKADGSVLRSGTWANGKFVGSERAPVAKATSISAVVSRLPPCKAYETWTNCVGTISSTNGAKYVGEFEDGERNGQGTEFRADGSVLRSGIWANGNFVSSR